MNDGGKGSVPRPYSVPVETYQSNWDLIFNKKEVPESDNEGALPIIDIPS
jgi:hypothetical protein